MLGVVSTLWLVPFLANYALARMALGFLLSFRARRAALVLAAFPTLALALVPFDGWPGALLPLVWDDDTEFALGYSAMEYWSVHKGMTKEEVVARLGEPLVRWRRDSSGEEDWRWTRSPHGSSYRIRSVLFREGRVSGTFSEFYVD
jgi:hypothetical protein